MTHVPGCRPWLAALALALLVGTGCQFDEHRNMGATEKLAHSEVNYVARTVGTPVVSIFDSLFSPFTALCDHADAWWNDTSVYHPDHHYLTYAGLRTVSRSDLHDGYKWLAGAPAIVIETVWLPITGLVDLGTVLCCGADDTAEAAAARQASLGYDSSAN